MLSGDQLIRYGRQIALPEWGEEGQRRLRDARLVVVGVGGLGSSVLTYLAAAGVGEIRVVDGDTVELSNLNRQVLHADRDIGRNKVESARERLTSLNPELVVEAVADVVTEANVFDIIGDYPIVDATDNIPTRHLLNRAAIRKKLPIFHGAIYGFEGRATTVIPGKTACLRCLYRGALPGGPPVVGATAGVIGCIQATEVLKYVLGQGELLTNRLLVYDGLSMRFSEVGLKKNPDCEDCG